MRVFMKVYLMQHGQALPAQIDVEEGLSKEGKLTILHSAQGLKKLGVQIDILVSSPKKRALETAQIIQQEIICADQIVSEKIKAKSPVEESIQFLQGISDKESIFLVGHLPSLKEIVSFLLCTDFVEIDFCNGGCCLIETEELLSHRGSLRWYLRAEQLGNRID